MGLADTADQTSLSSRLRARRDVQLRALISDVHDQKGAVRIIDMGGTPEYWQRVGLDFLRASNTHVTIINLHATELDRGSRNEDLFSFAVGNACDLHDFPGNSFDIAHSNSVIEHVLTWGNMKNFARETRRVAPWHYVQTPYFWFPVDPHFYRLPFYHWLPRPMRAKLLMLLPLAHVGRIGTLDKAHDIVEGAKLIDRAQMELLFPDSQHSFERFYGLPKSMIAIRGPS
ncbi:MAG: class I SAM-dependent methyltransferase [Alphaproteobacteria bacterium]|nr:class I SAM-dependent methyltransferase [Alphaproteobacteria bacterium]